MGFNRDVIRRRRDEMHELGVRVRWAGRAPRLWKSVIKELQVAEELTRGNDVLTLTMCVNYGGRAELADTARSIAREVAAGRLDPDKVDEQTFARHLYVPEVSDADLVWRTSGEQRLSNFMLWQAAYSELVFTDVLWPDVDRRHLWAAIEAYAGRDRRYGGALPEHSLSTPDRSARSDAESSRILPPCANSPAGAEDERQAALNAALETIENQRRFAAAILDTVDIGLVLLDRDGRYQTMNRRHARLHAARLPRRPRRRAGQLGEVYAEDGVTRLERERDAQRARAARARSSTTSGCGSARTR